MNDFQVLILAGGNGSRMNRGDLPKVLVPLNGQPMIEHLLGEIAYANLGNEPAIVVSHKAEEVIEALGDQYLYIHQPERKGTGHAVQIAREFLEDKAEHLIVLYGDHPFVTADTLSNLAETHEGSGAVLTLATVEVPNFKDWRAPFQDFGRVVRDQWGQITKIVEKKDATADELKILEVNPAYFAFRTDWLWRSIGRLTNDNAQGEYYLTDLVALAVADGETIGSVTIDAKEGLGVNTPEQLALLENLDPRPELV